MPPGALFPLPYAQVRPEFIGFAKARQRNDERIALKQLIVRIQRGEGIGCRHSLALDCRFPAHAKPRQPLLPFNRFCPKTVVETAIDALENRGGWGTNLTPATAYPENRIECLLGGRDRRRQDVPLRPFRYCLGGNGNGPLHRFAQGKAAFRLRRQSGKNQQKNSHGKKPPCPLFRGCFSWLEMLRFTESFRANARGCG